MKSLLPASRLFKLAHAQRGRDATNGKLQAANLQLQLPRQLHPRSLGDWATTTAKTTASCLAFGQLPGRAGSNCPIIFIYLGLHQSTKQHVLPQSRIMLVDFFRRKRIQSSVQSYLMEYSIIYHHKSIS